MLQKNVGTLDKIIRLTISIVLFAWLVVGAPIFGSTLVTWIVAFFAFANAVTGLLSICVVYSLLDLSTSRED